jgi:MFS family permease
MSQEGKETEMVDIAPVAPEATPTGEEKKVSFMDDEAPLETTAGKQNDDLSTKLVPNHCFFVAYTLVLCFGGLQMSFAMGGNGVTTDVFRV